MMPAGQVSTGTAEPQAAIGGYSILEGSEAEVKSLQAHPVVARGGTLQLNLVIDPLLVADWVPPQPDRTEGLMIVFDGGVITPEKAARI